MKQKHVWLATIFGNKSKSGAMLLDDFYGTLGALHLACSANKAFIEVHYFRFLIFDF